jgi:hypothetical protein
VFDKILIPFFVLFSVQSAKAKPSLKPHDRTGYSA